jgi:hypothetical protein
VLWALCARTAHAQPQPRNTAALTYEQGPSECPDQAAFVRMVRIRLGYDPFAPSARQALDLRFAVAGGRVVAKLAFAERGTGAAKTRDTAIGRCSALAESLATTVAMAIDPLAAGSAPPAAGAPSAPPIVPTQPPRDGAERAAPNSLQPARTKTNDSNADAGDWKGALGAQLLVNARGLPAVAPGIGIALQLNRGGFGLTLGARYVAQLASAQVQSRDRADASVLGVAAHACTVHENLDLCAGLRVGALSARSTTVVVPRRETALAVDASVLGRGHIALDAAVSLAAAVELGAPLRPVRYDISGREVYVQSPLDVTFSAGISIKVF